MFEIGQVVVYTTYGVCKINSVTSMSFSGQTIDYYILKPLKEAKTELTVPIDNPITLARLHELLTKDEVSDLLEEIPVMDTFWIENDNLRKKEFSEIIKRGDRKETIKMLKSIRYHQLSLRNKARKLHAVDEQAMKEAFKLIVDEFSYVLDANPLELRDKIDNDILTSYEEKELD